MRKRVRKKKGIGEFEVPVIPIAFRMARLNNDGRNLLLDRFAEEAIEENRLQFGGGGLGEVWSGYAEPEHGSYHITEAQRDAVYDWLSRQEEVVDHFVGEIMRNAKVDAVLKVDPEFPASRVPSNTEPPDQSP